MNIEISYERNRTRYQPELHIFIKPREPIDDFRHVVGEDNEKNIYFYSCPSAMVDYADGIA